ncbi:MAG: flagellar basal body rod protein FlgC [Micavibrio sp.]|nr:flagellar basal body rod protein FlgC [Micavibrio sp.]HCK32495.1 flagellar basal body rod protein FlgC [Rhodospirillaceae bacterium]|tara:strand:- start:704 stop:1117 length:414 start_codon:yes stop_codon:yes gene_type:complete
MDDLIGAMSMSTHGMKAQTNRIRVISENVANADSYANAPGEEPYQRKIVTFKNMLDRENDMRIVEVDEVKKDTSEFGRKYMPGHPGADADGYVTTPNVKTMIEMMDMREAQRSYEANLNVMDMSRNMANQTIGLLDQ